MLYGTPELAPADKAVLGEIEDMRRDLKYRLAAPHRCDGQLRRRLQARAIQGSNAIEGYRASVEDIESIMLGEEPLEASSVVTSEIAGYQQALTYIRHLSLARSFRFDAGILHALNFMMIGHHHDETPGTVRPDGIYVRDSATGEVVYEGPEAEAVPALLDELAEWLNGGDLEVPSHVRAAMAHLNLVAVHPWRDGNGRMSRALQTLVLGRDQILTPEFSSIEEWLGSGRTSLTTTECFERFGGVPGTRTIGRSPGCGSACGRITRRPSGYGAASPRRGRCGSCWRSGSTRNGSTLAVCRRSTRCS
jgi:Fic family protein